MMTDPNSNPTRSHLHHINSLSYLCTTRIALPFWIAGCGILCSAIGFFFVSTKDNASQKELLHALHKGTASSSVLVLGASAAICGALFGTTYDNYGWKLFTCIVIGLVCGIMIGEATEVSTAFGQ